MSSTRGIRTHCLCPRPAVTEFPKSDREVRKITFLYDRLKYLSRLVLAVVLGPLARLLVRITALKDNPGFARIGIRVLLQVLISANLVVAG